MLDALAFAATVTLFVMAVLALYGRPASTRTIVVAFVGGAVAGAILHGLQRRRQRGA